MRRILTIYVVLGALHAAPALCVGGAITHACECASESGCPCAIDCQHESRCGHEGECPDDPCSARVVRPEREGDDFIAVSPTVVSTTVILANITQPPVQTERTGTHKWPGGNNLPFPVSDLPLLI